MKKQPPWVQKLLAPAGITINGNEPWDIKINNPAVYRRFLTGGSLGLGEAYMQGWWECASLDQFFTKLLSARVQDRADLSVPILLQSLKSLALNLQAMSRAFEVAKKHYDLGNEFFVAMLGQSMAYSCGYWRQADDLDAAQLAKYELICRKLRLQAGQRILDIGCGWGGFAKYAASRYKVSVVGVTVSKEQLAFAKEACRGLPVEFRLQDYRTLHETFDHIVSIGMFEHVGPKNYATYMQVAKRCLKEDGLFLLHTIGSPVSSHQFDPWMDKYIFPNAHLPSLSQISRVAEKLFVIEDVRNFGADYDKTLMAWYQKFQVAWPTFKDRYDQAFYRMWKYYLLSCAGMFRSRNIELWQIVLSPHGVKGGYESVR